MLFSSVATAVILFASSQAAAYPSRRHLADFRLFSGPKCGPQNLGIWTVVEGDFKPNECKSLNDNTIKSVRVEDIVSDCKLFLYTDDKCHENPHQVSAHECKTAPHGSKFKTWSMSCQY